MAATDRAEACLRAAAKITAVPPVPADRTDLFARIAALGTLAAGRWARLSSEPDLPERQLASATSNFRDTERSVAAPYDLNAAMDAVSRFQQAVLAMGAGRL